MIIYLIGVIIVFVLCTIFLIQDLYIEPVTMKELIIVLGLSICSWVGLAAMILLVIAQATHDDPFWNIIIIPKRKK